MKKTVIELFRGLYRLCLCDCGKLTTIINKQGRPKNFILGHSGNTFLKGELNPKWNGGRSIDKDKYVLIYNPDHPFANRHGQVREHRLVMEQHLKRYLSREEQVHHKKPVRKGGTNDIENLQLFASNSEHVRFEKTKDKSDWFCFLCGSDKTYVYKKKLQACWYKFENNIICHKCYRKKKRLSTKETYGNT